MFERDSIVAVTCRAHKVDRITFTVSSATHQPHYGIVHQWLVTPTSAFTNHTSSMNRSSHLSQIPHRRLRPATDSYISRYPKAQTNSLPEHRFLTPHMSSSSHRDVSPLGEKPRPGSNVHQRYASDYRSVSPIQERKTKPEAKAKPDGVMVARLDEPGYWDLVPKKM